MYWPKDDTACNYGPFEVHLEHEKVMSNYTLRALKLRHLKVRIESIYAKKSFFKRSLFLPVTVVMVEDFCVAHF